MFDFYNATADELTRRGWRLWSAHQDLYLCPASQFATLPNGIALYSTSGAVAVKGRDYIDDDTRGGVLAYGIIPGKTRTNVSAVEVAMAEAARRAEFKAKIMEVSATGVFDLATGRMLHGGEAQAAMRQTFGMEEES